MVNAVYSPQGQAQFSAHVQVKTRAPREIIEDPENFLLRDLLMKDIVAALNSQEFATCSKEARKAAAQIAEKLAPRVAAETTLSLAPGPEDDGAVELILDHSSNGRRVAYLIESDGENAVAFFVGGSVRPARRSKLKFVPTDLDLVWILA